MSTKQLQVLGKFGPEKVTVLSTSSTDDQYPSAKAVVDYVSANSGSVITCGTEDLEEGVSELADGHIYIVVGTGG